jgi:hypothetical protein
MESDQPAELNTRHDAKPGEVPVFGCVVYVSSVPGVGVRARVATLAGLESTAATERDALRKIVTAFKQCVAEHLRCGTAIPWIDPPVPAESHEQQRLIPVHL